MGLFEHFPYTNFHDLNLDWILRKIKNHETRITTLEEKVDEHEERITTLENTASNHEERISKNERDISDLNERVDSIEDIGDRMDTAEDNIRNLQSTVSAHSSAISSIQSAIQSINATISNIQQSISNMVNRLMPSGGTPGQVLTKYGNSDYQANWIDPPSGLPSGGTIGQILHKYGDGDGQASWIDPPNELPSGGTTGQVLAKAGDGAQYVWRTLEAIVSSYDPEVHECMGLDTAGTSGDITYSNFAPDANGGVYEITFYHYDTLSNNICMNSVMAFLDPNGTFRAKIGYFDSSNQWIPKCQVYLRNRTLHILALSQMQVLDRVYIKYVSSQLTRTNPDA